MGKPQHVVDKRSSLIATKTNSYTKDCVKQNTSPSTQRTNCGLRAVKTYGNVESRARCKEDYREAMNSSTEGCNQEGT